MIDILSPPACFAPDDYALFAWPAEYRNFGVMTFLIHREGVVYRKDLREKTSALAKAITAYDPDDTPAKVE